MRENTRAKTVAAAVAAIVFLLASAGAYELWATDTARRNFESGEVQWDTGDYRTEPTAFRPIDTTDQSLKTFLYGNHVVLPYELDSRLYISPGYNPAYTTSALRGWATLDQQAVITEKEENFLGAFQMEGMSDDMSLWAANAVMRFSSPEIAREVAESIAQVDRARGARYTEDAKNSSGVAAEIAGHPDVLATRIDRRLSAVTSQGAFLVYTIVDNRPPMFGDGKGIWGGIESQEEASDEQNEVLEHFRGILDDIEPNALDIMLQTPQLYAEGEPVDPDVSWQPGYVGDFFDKQIPELQKIDTDATAVNPEGVLDFTLLNSDAELRRPITEVGPRIAIAEYRDVAWATELFERAGIDLVAMNKVNLLRTQNERAALQFVEDFETLNDLDFSRYEEPQGVPGTTCWSRDQENGTTYNCALVYGRYVAVAHSDDLINDDNDGSARYDLSQKIAAQYLLLQQMPENKK